MADDTEDRLTTIKARRSDQGYVYASDMEWLIGEVERLRVEMEHWRDESAARDDQVAQLQATIGGNPDLFRRFDAQIAEIERLRAELKGALKERADAVNHANQVRPDDWKQQRTHLVAEIDRLKAELSRIEDADVQGDLKMVAMENELDRLRGLNANQDSMLEGLWQGDLAADKEIERLRLVLVQILDWDMLTDPDPQSDFPWLKRLIENTLNA